MLNSQSLGRLGEKIAASYLRLQDYKIISRNLRLGRQEIDIIALQKDWTVFIEVKSATRNPGAITQNALKPKQISGLKRAMEIFSRRKNLNFEHMRLDLILIFVEMRERRAELIHYRDIFFPPQAGAQT